MIRYNAYIRTFDGAPLSEWYLLRNNGNEKREDTIQALFHLDALNNVKASFVEEANNMKESQYDLEEFSSQYKWFRGLLEKTFDSIKRAAGGHIVFRD